MAMAITPSACKEQLIFPEIDYDKIDKLRGLEVCIVTTASTDAKADHARRLGHALPQERPMAKKSLIAKANRPARYSTQAYHRCGVCGRPRAYMRKFGMCRICFRPLASRTDSRRQEELVVTND